MKWISSKNLCGSFCSGCRNEVRLLHARSHRSSEEKEEEEDKSSSHRLSLMQQTPLALLYLQTQETPFLFGLSELGFHSRNYKQCKLVQSLRCVWHRSSAKPEKYPPGI